MVFRWWADSDPLGYSKNAYFGNNKSSALVYYVKWLEYTVERAKYITGDILVHIHALTSLRSVNTFH